MSMDIFFTQQAQTSNQTGTLSAALSVAPTDTSVFDQIIASLRDALKQNSDQDNGQHDTVETNKNETGPLTSDDPALAKDIKLDVAALLSSNKDVKETLEEDIETFALNVQAQISEALELNKQALDQDLNLSDIKLVIAKFPENQKAEIANFLQGPLAEASDEELGMLNRLEAVLNKIEKLVSEDTPVLLVTNLTPEQITDLKAYINNSLSTQERQIEDHEEVTYSAAENNDVLSNVFIGLISISAPQTQGLSSEAPAQRNAKTSVTTPTLTAQPTNTALPTTGAPNINSAPLLGGEDSEGITRGASLENKDFKDALKATSHVRHDTSTPVIAKENSHAIAQVKHNNLSYLTNHLNIGTSTGTIMSPLNDITSDLSAPGAGIPLTGPSPLSNLITQTQSAAHSHPTTQVITATLQKGAAGGKNTTITLQLNPEELGKIEVRLEFTKNQNIKAHMLVERPETHLMLQRDAHLLERALQDTGLDTDATITFDLANEGHDFGQNGGHDDHNNPNAKNHDNNEDEEIEVISTTMSWYVDPNTGMTRYDFLA